MLFHHFCFWLPNLPAEGFDLCLSISFHYLYFAVCGILDDSFSPSWQIVKLTMESLNPRRASGWYLQSWSPGEWRPSFSCGLYQPYSCTFQQPLECSYSSYFWISTQSQSSWRSDDTEEDVVMLDHPWIELTHGSQDMQYRWHLCLPALSQLAAGPWRLVHLSTAWLLLPRETTTELSPIVLGL